jgi:hypothetical protein
VSGSQVPKLSRLRGEVRDDTLYVKAMIFPRGRSARAITYDPDHAGGWALQLFVDADAANNPYWNGYESVVRGSEWNRARGTFVIRRITFEEGTPGGWGPSSGNARFRLKPMGFELAVPLSSLGNVGGTLNFAIETYATVACPECESGVSAEMSEDYFGVATRPGGQIALDASRQPVLRGFAPGTHSAAVDMRLVAAVR